ncbi:DUF475 domain-containing protein [Microbacterium sp. 77mftsu3.1]|uniref:DUF475 domain-containing protein n=1 Tax=Microbacterium sp. 77mftsu3.1 TaxID=1761802 RepID=UPI0003785888|nr:DUF475 domain-containing protein [Microbacterium sp. 77mftsu3.1]
MIALRHFKWSMLISLVAIAAGYFYGGWAAVFLVVILGIMEVTLSFDNAVVNARVLEKMSLFWQRMFLTVGIVIAVFGMRLIFPLAIVSVTTGLSFAEVITLALEKGDPHQVGTFGHYLHDAHPQIAAFGGVFLLMLFLDFIFEKREITWLSWLEKPLGKLGSVPNLSYVVVLGALLAATAVAHEPLVVLTAGIFGLITYVLVGGLGELFDTGDDDEDEAAEPAVRGVGKQVGKAAFFSFLYLEVLDASFSFDGAIGAFAITADPILIALGLGIIGAIFVRSLTVFFLRQGTLDEFPFLDHGAHWAIGALATILLVSIVAPVPEVITGLIGMAFIISAFVTSIVRNKREAKASAAAVEVSA